MCNAWATPITTECIGPGMGRNTTKRAALTPETKALLDEKKPEGVTTDFYLKHAIKHAPPLSEG